MSYASFDALFLCIGRVIFRVQYTEIMNNTTKSRILLDHKDA